MAPTSSLKLASFDGGGPRAFSQLIMMKRFMHQLRWNLYPNDPYKVMLPCDYFDLIGGSDTGGIIAIMFARLRMSVDDAIFAFGGIIKQVYAKGLKREERTKRLRECMEALLEKQGLPIELKLERQNSREGCLGFVMATASLNVPHKVCFRTYLTRDDPPTDVTVVDAALATCASPAQFLPITIGAEYEETEYTGAGVGANNPVRQVLLEASSYYQANPTVLLSLGSGHPGILALDRSRDDLGLYELMHGMMIDCEQEDTEVRQQWPDAEFYFRFSVVQGMQKINRRAEEHQWIAAQTNAYFKLPETIPKVSECVNKMSLQAQNSQHIYTFEGPPAYIVKEPTVKPPSYGRSEIAKPIDKPIKHGSAGVSIEDTFVVGPVKASPYLTPGVPVKPPKIDSQNSRQINTLEGACDYDPKEAKPQPPPSHGREELVEELIDQPIVKPTETSHSATPIASTNTWSEFFWGLLP